jgi:hypothetical protein
VYSSAEWPGRKRRLPTRLTAACHPLRAPALTTANGRRLISRRLEFGDVSDDKKTLAAGLASNGTGEKKSWFHGF